jgi:hypothetical protein
MMLVVTVEKTRRVAGVTQMMFIRRDVRAWRAGGRRNGRIEGSRDVHAMVRNVTGIILVIASLGRCNDGFGVRLCITAGVQDQVPKTSEARQIILLGRHEFDV